MSKLSNTERQYIVSGLTCSHCVSSVREKVADGADSSDEAVRIAVAAAGHEGVS